MANTKITGFTADTTPVGADLVVTAKSPFGAGSNRKVTLTDLFGAIATTVSPAANDGVALGTGALSFSDLFLASGGVINWNNGDVTLTHSANTLAFAGGTSYTFNDVATINKSTTGSGLRVNVTSTAYTTATGAIQVVRSGALTGVDTEYVTDLLIAPTFALTEPGAGTFTYRGANIDISGMSVTAGAGTSNLTALRLAANADADAGTHWALMVASGRSQFNDHITFGTGVAVNTADYMIGRDTTATNILTLGVPTGASAQVTVNGAAAVSVDATTVQLTSTRLTFTTNIATASTAKNIHGVSAAIRYNVPTGSRHDFTVNGSILAQITGASHSFANTATTSGSTTAFTITTPANTNQTASTEEIAINLNTSATVEFATGALALQRAVVVQAPTYAFVGASTLSDASTFDITGAPTAGTNATITRAWGLTVGRDTDTKVALGRWALTTAVASDWATLSHYDAASSGSYALAQNTAGGTTILNAASGGSISFRINNAARMALDANTLTLTTQAVAGGATSLSITPPTHTAVATEKIDYSFVAHSQTINSAATIALVRSMVLGGVTYGGVAGGGTETVTTAITLEVDVPVQGSDLTLTNAPVAARFLGNTIIGNILPPAAGPTNTLFIGSGTAPTATVADSIALYSSDSTAGNTVLSLFTEGTTVATETVVSDTTMQIRVNGTLYKILLKA